MTMGEGTVYYALSTVKAFIMTDVKNQSKCDVTDPRFRLKLPNNMATNTEDSTPLMPEPATGHDPEPVSSISYPHNVLLQDPS
jgi:hypothetical protein